jgi:hypothetical protein
VYELTAVDPVTHEPKYSDSFLDLYVNKAQTYCETHKRMHTLWDYLEADERPWRDFALNALARALRMR